MIVTWGREMRLRAGVAVGRLVALGVALGGVLLAHESTAASPMAIVEEAPGHGAGVAAYDLLREGQVIDLPAGATLTIGYFDSCTQEVIRGGHVVIGQRESQATGGQVKRETLRCPQPAKIELTAAVVAPSPKLNFRGGAKQTPSLIIYYTSPVIMLSNPGEVVIERVDHVETAMVFKVDTMLDLAKQKIYLNAGGVYKLSVGNSTMLFQVSLDAMQGGGPLLARLLRL